MISVDLITANLLSPAVICFAVGAFAAIVRSDLRVPSQVYETISMYLLFAIGLKGGIALDQTEIGSFIPPLFMTLALGIFTPVVAYAVARYMGRLSNADAGAMAAHFGSVSAVTFMAALNFALLKEIEYEGFLTALLIILEIPGIIIALIITRLLSEDKDISLGNVVREAITSKSVILMGGGLLVGLLTDEKGIEAVTNVFITPFNGVLAFFLLEMGIVAANKMRESKTSLPFMLLFGTVMPIIFGGIGLLGGHLAGLSIGGAAIFATMVASASYIAAPVAVKMALPEANEGLYLTTAISITLPFNLLIGIPLYFALSNFVTF